MHRILPTLLLALAAAPAQAAERRFVVTDFERVQIDGPFEVTLVTGRPSAAVAQGDPRALDRVDIEVQGRLLKVSRNISGWGGYPGEREGPVTIALATRALRGAFVRGSGGISIAGGKALQLELSVTGSGRIALDKADVDRLDLGLVGSGRILLAGKAKTLRASIEGAGDLDAAQLAAQDVEINAGTSGFVKAAASRAAKVNASGSGDVEIIGSPACTVAGRGAGVVSCGARR